MKNRKLLILSALMLTTLSFTSCGNKKADTSAKDSSTPASINSNQDSPTSNKEENSVYYTVTFDSKGGTNVQSQNIDAKSGLVQSPTSPTKEGYTFINWSTSNSANNVFDFNTKITSDITLYAVWEDKVCVLSLYEGETKLDTKNFKYNANVTLETLDEKFDAYFEGWYYDKDFNNKVESNSFQIKNNTEVYAKYTNYEVFGIIDYTNEDINEIIYDLSTDTNYPLKDLDEELPFTISTSKWIASKYVGFPTEKYDSELRNEKLLQLKSDGFGSFTTTEDLVGIKKIGIKWALPSNITTDKSIINVKVGTSSEDAVSITANEGEEIKGTSMNIKSSSDKSIYSYVTTYSIDSNASYFSIASGNSVTYVQSIYLFK